MAVNTSSAAGYLSPNRAQRLYISRHHQTTCFRIPIRGKTNAGGGGGISGGGGGGEEEEGEGSSQGEKKWYLVRASSSDFESHRLQQQQQRKGTTDLLGLSDVFEIDQLLGDTTHHHHHHHHRCDMSSPVVFKEDCSAMAGFGVIASTLFFAYLGLRDLVEVSVDYSAKLLNKRYTNVEVSQEYSADMRKHDPTKI